jgi:hypothetical protein
MYQNSAQQGCVQTQQDDKFALFAGTHLAHSIAFNSQPGQFSGMGKLTLFREDAQS